MWLTASRIVVCPFLIALMMLEDPIWGWVAAGIFIAASMTDWFDGHFARKYGVISNMGKFMDPIADKILVAAVLIMLVPSARIGPVVVILLLTRDILIGGIRSIAAADRVIIDAKAAGKWKTGMQMVAIPALLIPSPVFGLPVHQAAVALLWISVILSIFSGAQYVMLYLENRKSES